MPRRAAIHEVEAALARAGEVYLVGSANWGVPGAAIDHDYAIAGDTITVATETARAFSGKHVVMDASRGHVRVVLPRAGVLDIAPLMGGSLSTDLAARDFTVNAIAAPLPHRSPVYDPFRGLTDLRYGLVRQVSTSAMPADPLRVLRGVRLVAERGFLIEDATLSSMAAAAPLLSRVQPERAHTELMRALAAPGWRRAATLLCCLGVWQSLRTPVSMMPDGHRYALLVRHLSDGSEQLGRMPTLPGWPETSAEVAESTAVAVIAAAMTASDLPPDATAEVAASLRFSRKQADMLVRITGALAAIDSGTTDGATLAGDYGFAAALAACLAGRADVFATLQALRPVPRGVLPNGAELLRHLQRRPGPWLGELVRSLQRAASRGEIASRADAWRLAESLAKLQVGGTMMQETEDDATG